MALKVLHLISSGGVHGAEQVVLALARCGRARGEEVIVGALHDPGRPAPEILTRARDEGLPTYALRCRGRFDPGAEGRLRAFLRGEGVEILHTHNYKSDVIGGTAAGGTGVSLVATVHGYTAVSFPVRCYERLDRFFLPRRFDRIIAVSEGIGAFFPAERRRLIPNGIDLRRFVPDERRRVEARRRWGIVDKAFVIGTVGRLSREKNQRLLLDAAGRLRRDIPGLCVLIAGDGPAEEDLKAVCRRRGLEDRVRFVGRLPEALDAYAAMDVFVLPSLTEGIPLALLEAMACRRAVAATRVGGVPSVVEDGRTGMLVDSGDAEALAGCLLELAHSEGLRRRLGGSARKEVEARFSLEAMCRAYWEVYEELSARA